MTLLRLASARTFASLHNHRNYRLFFTGQLASVAGTWMQNIALAWVVIQLAPHSRGIAVGILTVCRFGPFTLLGLVAGVVTDRFDNRRTVIVTQSVQMVLSGRRVRDAEIVGLEGVDTWPSAVRPLGRPGAEEWLILRRCGAARREAVQP